MAKRAAAVRRRSGETRNETSGPSDPRWASLDERRITVDACSRASAPSRLCHADGSPHEVARLAEKFARRLEARFGVPVAFVDETLSSAEAESTLRETRTRAGKKSDVDTMAATLILQSFLDELPRGASR